MDISINGAKILFTIENVPLFGRINISQTLVMSWIVMAIITALCLWLGSGLSVEKVGRKQAVAEMAVTSLVDFVHGNMGTGFDQYIPLVGALFASSVVSNLISLLGFWSPTADLSTELGWAIVVFVLITYYKIKSNGILGYLKGYLDPIFLMAPINVISEFFTPISMACRHFGNILSGTVITALLYAALAAASGGLLGLIRSSVAVALAVTALGAALIVLSTRTGKRRGLYKVFGIVLAAVGGVGLLGLLPGALGEAISAFPLLDIGIPALTSLYFDWFGGCIQAFIFCTLTTIFIKQAAGDG